MANDDKRSERAIALFAAGAVALGFPVVGLFSGGEIFGAPSLFVYLFVAWLALIVLVALNLRSRGGKPADRPNGPRR
jgi:hypothetical protein